MLVSVQPDADPLPQEEADSQGLEDAFQELSGVDWACMRCGAGGILRVFSAEARGGVLYVADFRQPGFDPGDFRLLCRRCMAEWLMREARMGYDLHTHASGAVCSAGCAARRDGRRTQYLNLMSAMADSKAGFLMAKAIDGMPGVNATPCSSRTGSTISPEAGGPVRAVTSRSGTRTK